MYSRFLKASQYAKSYHQDSIRGDRIAILELLGDIEKFSTEQNARTEDYLILNDFLIKINGIDTSERGYHRFKYFASILAFLGFTPSGQYTNQYIADVDFLLALTKSILNFEYETYKN